MQKIVKITALIICSIFSGRAQGNDFVYLFAHGLYANHSLAHYYAQIPEILITLQENTLLGRFKSGYECTWDLQHPDDAALWIIKEPFFSFNFPDAARNYDGSQTSLAQKNEIQTLAHEYEKIKDKKVILAGMSRGASTILNFLGTCPSQSVVAAVVESPFDSIIETLDTLCKIAGVTWVPSFIRHTSPKLFFSKFDEKGIFPINVAQHINKNLPLLIIASLEDTLIPAANSASIYFKLQECGHKNAYFLLLDKGPHAYLLEHDDAYIYLNAVHAFYKKHNLPHNPSLAHHGQSILAHCQPSKKIVDEALKNKKSFIKR